MSYVPVGITEEESRDAMLDLRRREVSILEKQYADSQKSKTWENLIKAATVVIPLLTFFGVKEYFKSRRRRNPDYREEVRQLLKRRHGGVGPAEDDLGLVWWISGGQLRSRPANAGERFPKL